MEKFAEVLSDPVIWLAFCLDRLALKKLSNKEVYEHTRKIFYEELRKKRIHRNQRKEQLQRQRKGPGL